MPKTPANVANHTRSLSRHLVPPAPRVFITYRRVDTRDVTGRLRADLERFYGPQNVFQDVVDIPAGRRFMDIIREQIDQCTCQLVMVGTTFSTVTGPDGMPRLDHPTDPVALEIGIGLARAKADGIIVIPVLTDPDVKFPLRLPATIAELTDYNARQLHDTTYDADLAELKKQIGLVSPLRRLFLNRRRTAATAMVPVVALISAIALWPSPTPPVRLGVDSFNVAVARFRDVRDGNVGSSDVARGLGEAVAAAIPRKLENGQQVEVVTVGALKANPDQTAKTLASRMNADVVLYGDVVNQGDTSILRTSYLLDGSFATYAGGDLAGPYHLDDERFRTSDKGGLQELRKGLVSQSESLVELLSGLDSFANDRPKEAETTFTRIDARAVLMDAGALKTLYFFWGSAEARLLKWSDAKAKFERAVAVDPAFGRAQLGLAEADFQLASHGCEGSKLADPAVDAALAQVGRARRLPDPGGLSNLETRAASIAGRIHVCRGLFGIEAGRHAEADAAREEYAKVIDDFRGGDHAAATPAMTAYADRAALSDLVDHDLSGAAGEYAKAAAIADQILSPRFGFYEGNRACVLLRAGRTAEANAAYGAAIKDSTARISSYPPAADWVALFTMQRQQQSCSA